MCSKTLIPCIKIVGEIYDVLLKDNFLYVLSPEFYSVYEIKDSKISLFQSMKTIHGKIDKIAKEIKSSKTSKTSKTKTCCHGLFFNNFTKIISNITVNYPNLFNTFLGQSKMDSLTGNIYNLKTQNHYVEVMNIHGEFVRIFGQQGTNEGQLLFPSDLCINEILRQIYIVDKANNRVNIYSTEGIFLKSFGHFGEKNGEFSLPSAIVINNFKYEIIIADTGNQRLQFFDFDGKFIRSFVFNKKLGIFTWPTKLSLDSETGKLAVFLEPIQLLIIL